MDPAIVQVAKAQSEAVTHLTGLISSDREAAEREIAKVESILQELKVDLPEPRSTLPTEHGTILDSPATLRPWRDLTADAQHLEADITALLSSEDVEAVTSRLQQVSDAALADARLDQFDYAIAGIAAVLAGLVDVLLVQVPQHPGFLGAPGHQGGWLSNIMKTPLPESWIRGLEKQYPVAYDPTTSAGLEVPVAGLGPRTHRFQSLGHDPVLGWVFGVLDVLRGTFSAISKDGSFIVQTVSGAEPIVAGEHLFVRVLEAFRLIGGHHLSDVATPAGLPAPLMTLLQFFQFGTIGPRGYTIAELARSMYRSNYDFRHFLAGSVAVTMTEIVVRGAWIIRRLVEDDASIVEALPIANNPRLRRTLFLAHLGATAINTGKVAITQNPLGLSWTQWLTFFRYLIPEAGRVLGGDARSQYNAIDDHITLARLQQCLLKDRFSTISYADRAGC